MKTPERLAEALRLHREGMSYGEIAEHIDAPYKSVFNWINDPDGAKKKARVDSYRVACTECGVRTDGSVGRRREGERALCNRCAPKVDAIWTDESIVLAIQEWADDHGGVPPSANEWRNAARLGVPLPCVNEVRRHFGLWNDAIRAAGFEPHASGPVGGYTPLTPLQRRQCAKRYAAGETSVDIAADFGCAAVTVLKWVRAAGIDIRPNFIDQKRRSAA